MGQMEPEMLIPPELVPLNGLNAFYHNVSGMRQVMFTGNLSQLLVVEGRTRKRIQTGLEREVAKATFNHAFKRDAIVLAVIPRFSGQKFGEEFAINPQDIVIFEDYHTEQLDYMELTKFHIMHQHYGFEFQYDEDLYYKLTKDIKPKFSKGDVIASSPNLTPDGDYMYGLEANVLQISDPAVTEDGIKVSESFAKRFRTTAYETRTFTCGRSHYPINLNGNAEKYMPIPDIGDYISSNGMICSMRPFDAKFDPAYMSRKRLFKPTYFLDEATFGIPNAQVVDIQVLHNDQVPNPRLPEEMTRQFRKYYEADRRFYTEIVRQTLCRKNGKLSWDVNLSDELNQLVQHAIARAGNMLVEEGLWPKSEQAELDARKNFRGDMLDEYQVSVTYRYLTSVGEGPKGSDQHGGKGVFAQVCPDEDMPIDEFGIRADVMVFDASTVNRLNNGRQHEQIVGAAGRDIIRRLRKSYGLPELGVIPMDVIKDRVTDYNNAQLGLKNFAYLMGFYAIVSPKDHFAILSKPDTIQTGRHLRHLAHVLKDGDEPYGLFLKITSNSGIKMEEVIEAIRNGPYMPNMSPVTYRDHAGKIVTTRTPALIGPNYYLALEKTATDGSGVSSSKTNHFGVLARLTNADKYSRPGRETGTRTIGEAEARNEAKSMGAEPVADVMDMNNDPVVHKEVCATLLSADKPSNIEQVVDREKFPIGGHRPMNYARHQFICSGKNISRE